MNKYALLIGINYYSDPRNQLNGCINDIKNMQQLLITQYGYLSERITLMSDELDNKSLPIYPTKTNIFSQLNTLIKTVKSGDLIYLHYSGHGGQTLDRNKDESDRLDETIYSCTLEEITDDELYNNFVKYIPNDVKLRCIMDCCHSGTAIDLPYLYGKNGKISRESTKAVKGDCVMISGCRDNQTSADAYINYTFQGALTATLIKILKTKQTMDWKTLLTLMRYELKKGRYDQIPQLSFNNKLSILSNFSL